MNDDTTDSAPGFPALAVIGMAGRFPGAASIAELWENLRQGVESISFATPEELAAAGVDPALAADPRYVPAAGVLAGADRFDAALFGFTPREAELLDPQHRVFLECAWEALEDAGYDPAREIAGEGGGTVGVFGGASLNGYLLYNLLPSGAFAGGGVQAAIASDKDFLTTRVSYKLDLKGPSLDVQTACSTSLVAVVLACQSLLNYGCDLALAGGVSVREPRHAGYLYQENGILSPDGHCRPFDAAARGTVPGNGVGIVVLKRLEEAQADGDTIHAVIRGAAINNDGAAKVGFTAPSVAGQAEVVGMALAIAGVRPREVTYIETHGTATPMGDPIEVRALDRIFRADTSERGFCTLGSIKGNLGHLDAAAGVTGLIKAILALEHREIPPTLHFERPNPELDLDNGPFRVHSTLTPWKTDRLPRRAGVSSFGIGGTNAHVVLEEGKNTDEEDEKDEHDGAELLLFSARTPEALAALAARFAEHLEQASTSGPSPRPLSDIAFTLRRGRRQLPVRRAIVAADREAALAALQGAAPERVFTAEIFPGEAGERTVAFLFPGQGAQQAGMAGEIYPREAVFRREIDHCREILAPHLPAGLDLVDLLAPPPGAESAAAERLATTEIAQPALFAVEIALARLWMSWGVRPAAMLGHSLGELTAACLAGLLDLPDALALVALRGRLMQSLPPGAMLAVPLPVEELAALLEGTEIEIAAVNAPGRTVATGPEPAIADLAVRLAAQGIEARPLPVRHAFHSRAVEPILGPWAEALGRVRLQSPQIPFLSNRTGTWITAAEATDPAYWAGQLRQTVRFSAGLAELLAAPRRVLLEVGPGQTLAALARRQAGPQGETLVLSSLPHRAAGAGGEEEALLGALGRLWTAGVEIDWAAFRPGRGRRVPLPTYPFERQRYWIESGIESQPQPQSRSASPPEEAAPADRLWAPLWKEALPPEPVRDPTAVWLLFGEGGGLTARLVERLRAERRETVVAVAAPAGSGCSRLSEGAYAIDPGDPASYDDLLAAFLGVPLRAVHLWNLTPLAPIAGTGSLARLQAAVHRLPDPERVRIDLVTAGAVDPVGGEAPDREKAALLALAADTIAIRVVDLPASGTGEREERRRAERLLAELDAPSTAGNATGTGRVGTVVAWRGRRRWVESWEALPPAPLRTAGVVGGNGGMGGVGGACLVAGDFSEPGLGLALADALADLPGMRLALVGVEPPARRPGGAGLPPVPAPEWLAARERELRPDGPAGTEDEDRRLIDALCTWQVARCLARSGIEIASGLSLPLAELRRRLCLVPRYERLFQSLLRMISEDGLAAVSGEEVRFFTMAAEAAEVGSPEELGARIAARSPRLAAFVELLDHCARHLPQVLSGEIEGLSVLYPEGSSELLRAAVARAEQAEEREADLAPRLLALALAELAKPAGTPRPGPFRVLEVGAGQGLLTRRLLPALAQAGPVEYWFTDLGRAFVLRAERELAASAPPDITFRFGVLDISRDPEAQGFPRGGFHAVLGADVVHATPKIAETLGHLRSLLTPGGLLGLVETVRRQRWGDLVWGLTDGWWAFADPELRTISPLLAPDAWERVLAKTGFEAPRAWAREEPMALLLGRAPRQAAGDGPLFLRAELADAREGAALAAILAEARRRLGPLSAAVWAARAAGARDFAERVETVHPDLLVFASTRPADRVPLAALAEERAAGEAGAVLALHSLEGAPALGAALGRALTQKLPVIQAVVAAGDPRRPGQSGQAHPPGRPAAVVAPRSAAVLHDRPRLQNPYVAPRNEAEQTVAEIWRRALGIDRIGVDDNFLELGGDSLLALSVTHALEQAFGAGADGDRPFSLFENPTVAAVARFFAPVGGDDAAETTTDSADFDLRARRGERRRERRSARSL